MTTQNEETILITQGQFAVADREDIRINTLLGSCVACCIWDDVAGVGGMNHLLLAGERVGQSAGYDVAGVAEMECLINGIIKKGGRRERLKAKVFGGAQMLAGHSSRIGDANGKFALDYLEQESIPCLSQSLGGTSARVIRFWGSTGRVSMRLVDKPVDETPPPAAAPKGNDMELF